ncbi:hypothetical protein SDC9_96973 [bioreactor metagenome]|uniref:Uncharacterized protein n=1 Tax=bioreactor metagenome TaxID=1076179 RepID=A0A645AB50_9ZZZZ
MKIDKSEKLFIGILLILTFFLYGLHFLIFRDWHHIFIFGLGDLAFIPLEVIFVSLILHRVLESNEKKKQRRKLYMVIEIFFSEVGIKILRLFSKNDEKFDSISDDLQIRTDWDKAKFKKLKEIKKEYIPDVKFDCDSMEKTRSILKEQREFLVKLIENPVLLEHEKFTELLMAVFHFEEELRCRGDLSQLPQPDQDHLAKDAQRVYILLGYEWVDYMEHMQENYPYLFSFAIRVNPFNQEDDVIIK